MERLVPFGKYFLLERINVGGMAEVFKAKTVGVEGFEKLVAIKRILPSIAEDEEFIKMFIDEAKITSQLSHANLAQTFDLGRIDDAYYIAMEYVPGKDLRAVQERLRRRGDKVPMPIAAYFVSKVCEGLDYAHRKQDIGGLDLHIVHRDVSPQNVIVSYEGEVKLVDFGIAKAANKITRTQAGILKGKFGYMSPEQVRGLPLDGRSDIFAAGVVLYELCAGERLFTGSSDFSVLEKVQQAKFPPPRVAMPGISPRLEAVLLKALARDPEQRYQTAGDLAGDLQRYLHEAPPRSVTREEVSAFMNATFPQEGDRERRSAQPLLDSTRTGVRRPAQEAPESARSDPRPPLRPPLPNDPRPPTPPPLPARAPLLPAARPGPAPPHPPLRQESRAAEDLHSSSEWRDATIPGPAVGSGARGPVAPSAAGRPALAASPVPAQRPAFDQEVTDPSGPPETSGPGPQAPPRSDSTRGPDAAKSSEPARSQEPVRGPAASRAGAPRASRPPLPASLFAGLPEAETPTAFPARAASPPRPAAVPSPSPSPSSGAASSPAPAPRASSSAAVPAAPGADSGDQPSAPRRGRGRRPASTRSTGPRAAAVAGKGPAPSRAAGRRGAEAQPEPARPPAAPPRSALLSADRAPYDQLTDSRRNPRALWSRRGQVALVALLLAGALAAWLSVPHTKADSEGGGPSGSLTVTTEPEDALLLLDGAQVKAAIDREFTEPRLTTGTGHLLTARRAGFAERSQPIALRPGEKKVLAIQLELLPGTIVVRSAPAAAEIYLDDDRRGTTPDYLPAVDRAAPHTLRLEKKCFRPWLLALPAHGDQKEVSAALEPIPGACLGARPATPERAATPELPVNDPAAMAALGFLSLGSRPSANVLIDGAEIGRTTPLTQWPLPVGKHRIRLVVGGRRRDLVVDIRSGQTVNEIVDLRKSK